MRKDILEAFWKSYENHVRERYSKINRAEESDACLKATILSVNKNDTLKPWHEECMIMFPPVEQHHMIPFNDRWVQRQLTEKYSIEKMKERLIARSVSLDGLTQPINVQITV